MLKIKQKRRLRAFNLLYYTQVAAGGLIALWVGYFAIYGLLLIVRAIAI